MLRTEDIYEEILRNHSLSFLEHKKQLYNVSHQAKGINLDNCDDEITVNMYKHLNVIHEVYFNGRCCPTAKASASLMVDEIRGRTLGEALELAKRVRLLANNQINEDGLFDTLLKQLCRYTFQQKNDTTVRCVLLPWETMIDASRKHISINHFNNRDYSLYLE